MEHLKPKNREELEEAVEKAKTVLENGGLIIYPTDTIYGVGADATNESAIEKVYELKGRDENKPLSVIVSDLQKAQEYVVLNKLAENIAKKMLPGPITLILSKKYVLPETLTKGSDSLGIRIPDSFFCIALAQAFEKPFTTTSANKSGKSAGSIEDILSQFEDKSHLIDLIVDVGPLDEKPPSTILDISENSVKILREGELNMQAVSLVTLKDEQ